MGSTARSLGARRSLGPRNDSRIGTGPSSCRALSAARSADSDRSALWPDAPPEQQLGLVCASEAMLDLMRTTRRVASSNITVLITGETGTGKELLARAMHQCSQRSTAQVHSLQLHRRVARHARRPAVRLSPRRVHRRAGGLPGRHPRRRRRHAVPRRDRRGRARRAAQAAALPRVERSASARRAGAGVGRRPRRRCHQRRSRQAGGRRQVPRGPVLPAQRRPADDSAAARTPRGDPAAARSLPRAQPQEAGKTGVRIAE